MAIRVKITTKGVPLKQVMLGFKKRVELTKAEVRALGVETRDQMRAIINRSKKSKSSKGKLENTIDVEYFIDGVSWGVGNIDLLDKNTPYWKAVNYGHGGYTIKAKNAKYLRFPDKDGKIIYRKEIHNHAIRAMNFVERTVWRFRSAVLTLGKRIGRK